MKKIFWNASERRLRMFWRMVLGIGVILLAMFGLTLVGGAAASLVFGAFLGVPPEEAAEFIDAMMLGEGPPGVVAYFAFLTAAGALLGVWLAGRFLDRRWFYDFGLRFSRRWLVDFGFGLALGGILMGFVFIFQLAMGWVTVTGFFATEYTGQAFWTGILGPLVLFICVGIYEELLIRGYLFKNLAEGLKFLGVWGSIMATLLLSSAIFGLLHAGNPNATWVSTLNIALAGIFLALGMVLTGELAIPIGVHITWNFFQGNVFGFPVSGTATNQTTFIEIIQGGPALWTGGNFGPEAGLLGIIAILLGCLATWYWVRYRTGTAGLYTPLVDPDLRFIPTETTDALNSAQSQGEPV